METASDLHRRLSRSRLSPLAVRRLSRRVEDLCISLVDAMLIAEVRQHRHGRLMPPLAKLV